jgi:hypothetical protein
VWTKLRSKEEQIASLTVHLTAEEATPEDTAQMTAERRVEENSAIHHGQNVRTTQFLNQIDK